jgi:hypothetical protein
MALLSDALPPHLISRPAVHLTYARSSSAVLQRSIRERCQTVP